MLVNFAATPGYEDALRICLAAHVDTYPGVPGQAHPIIHDYAGGDIVLPHNGVIIPATDLVGLEGKRIITADGTTLLGADDKAGVAALMTLIDLLHTGQQPHGSLTFWFCVDEEVGQLGFAHLPRDLAESFGLFLTVDGTRLGHLDIGCFHGRVLAMTFHGQDAHPGEFPAKLKAAHYAAMDFLRRMSELYPSPWEGIKDPKAPFFYPARINGGAGETVLNLLPRAFDRKTSDEMVAAAIRVAEEEAANRGCTLEVTANRLAYVNNFEAIAPHPEIMAVLRNAHQQSGIDTSEHLVRGGTDGAMYNVEFPGTPTPNIGYGGSNFHGEQEFVIAEELMLVPQILLDALVGFTSLKARAKVAAGAAAEA